MRIADIAACDWLDGKIMHNCLCCYNVQARQMQEDLQQLGDQMRQLQEDCSNLRSENAELHQAAAAHAIYAQGQLHRSASQMEIMLDFASSPVDQVSLLVAQQA